jgi:hypothetical protein
VAQPLLESARLDRVALRIERKIWLQECFQKRTWRSAYRVASHTGCRTVSPQHYRLRNSSNASNHLDAKRLGLLYHPAPVRGSAASAAGRARRAFRWRNSKQTQYFGCQNRLFVGDKRDARAALCAGRAMVSPIYPLLEINSLGANADRPD